MALPSSNIWECRTTGSDTANGGGFDPSVTSPGTDFSQQDAAQVSYSDLVIGATTTNLTSAAHPFGATHVGNTVQITGGTGFTTGFYSVRSVSGTTATMDRAVGTAASTGGVGGLGGALASPGMAGAAHVAGNTIWLRLGTYTVTSATANVSGGCVSLSNTFSGTASTSLTGYGTTRGDGVRPTIIANGTITSFTLVATADRYCVVASLVVDGNSRTSSNGIAIATAGGLAWKCTAQNCTGVGITNGDAVECLASGCGTGFNGSTANVSLSRCVATGCSGAGFGSLANASRCLAYANPGHGFSLPSTIAWTLQDCTAYGNTGDGFRLDCSGRTTKQLRNCLATGNGGWGVNVTSAGLLYALGNATFSNTSGGINASSIANTLSGSIALTADPFMNAAGGNFGLNSTAGGGALCRAAGLGTFPGLSSTVGSPDIGAVQHADAGGGLLFGANWEGGYE